MQAEPFECSGGAAAAAAVAQLIVDGVSATIGIATVANVVQGHQESVALPQQAKPEVNAVPLTDPLADDKPTTTVPAVPSQQVLADPLATEQSIADTIYTSVAQQIQQQGKQVSGLFPRTASAGDILFRADQAGTVTHYQVYDANGNPMKRVDLIGATHGGIPTPHVLEYEQHTAPNGTIFFKPSKQVRPARPDEIP